MSASIIEGDTASVDSKLDTGADAAKAAFSNIPLQRAVVVEVLSNLSLRDDDQLKKLADPTANEGLPTDGVAEKIPENRPRFRNEQALERAPRNSVIVRLLGVPVADEKGYRTPSGGRNSLDTLVCYPFFSSHLSLPVKVGEQVWVFFEEPTQVATATEAWWVTRITGQQHVEDVNYSHLDRESDPIQKSEQKKLWNPETKKDDDEPSEDYDIVPSFHNGPIRNDADENYFTLKYETEFEDYFTESASKDDFVIEPVPRFTKRPGDLVLQGSHNSIIVLGTDRGWKHDKRPGDEKEVSNAHRKEALKEGLGAMDLVVGRGRLFGAPADFLDKDPEIGTEPFVVKNTRESHETNKNPGIDEDQSKEEPFSNINNRKWAAEGDPDFVNDASRIYLTMKSNPDDQFAILSKDIPTAFKTEPKKVEDTAAAIIKSDEIRIIARKDAIAGHPAEKASPKDAAVNGSIRIIKEGALDDDAAAIYLLPDGTIQVSGKVIYIGRTSDDGGKEAGPGEKGSEPYMRWSDFAKWADAFIDQLVVSFDKTSKKIKANAEAMAMGHDSGGSTGGIQILIGPNPILLAAWVAMFGKAMPQKTLAKTDLGTDELEMFKTEGGSDPKIETIKSERIFGE